MNSQLFFSFKTLVILFQFQVAYFAKKYSLNNFVQLGFSSNVASDTATSTNLTEGFSFCTEFKRS